MTTKLGSVLTKLKSSPISYLFFFPFLLGCAFGRADKSCLYISCLYYSCLLTKVFECNAKSFTIAFIAFACNAKKFLLFLLLFIKSGRTDESCLSNFLHLLS